MPISNNVNLKFNISRYINNPIKRNPSLIRVLTALEAAVASLQSKGGSSSGSGGGDKVDKLIDWMTSVPTFQQEMPKHYDEATGQDNRHLDF